MSSWLLVDRATGRPPTYFRFWTAIGPCGTYDASEAARFPSEQAAMQSPAFTFWGTFYRPELEQ
jgi:hypothetical protein